MGYFDKTPSKKELIKDNSTLQHNNNLLNNHVKREGFISKSRGKAPTGLMTGTRVRNGMFEPSVDPRLLILGPENNSVLGAVIEKIVTEATKDPKLYEWLPLFEAKCENCGEEYQEAAPEECEECGGTKFRKADKKQLYKIEKMFKHPNNDSMGRVKKTFKDITKTILHYQQTIDDYYLEVTWSFWGDPAEIFPMTSEAIRIKGDKTDKKWFPKDKFCPRCYVPDSVVPDKRKTCKKCNGLLKDTAYAQVDGYGHDIVMRWAEDEVLHDNTRAWGNRIYGMPKMWSVWVIAQTLKWIEYYNWSAYSKNEMPDSITVFPGLSQTQVSALITEAIAYKKENPDAPKNVWLGAESGDPPVHIKTLPTLVEMNTVEFAKYLRESIAIRYGVSLNMLGVQTPGKLGKETEQIEVSYDTIVESQTQYNEFINTKLLPLFKNPGITEWRFALLSPKKDDELRKAQIYNMHMATVVSGRSSGLDLAINPETWEPEIREQPPPPDPSTFGAPSQFSASTIEYPDKTKAIMYQRNQNYLPPGAETCPKPFFKGLSPRNIPPADAVTNLRGVEDDFVKAAIAEYDAQVEVIILSKGTEARKLAQIEALSEELVTNIQASANQFYLDAYMVGLNEEVKSFGADRAVRFTQVDESALEVLANKPKGILDSIKTFGEEQVKGFREIIEESYAAPGGLDLDKMVKRMEEASGGGRSSLERIARSETTKISNSGRATQFEKYADPDKREYHWIIANHPRGDDRISDQCLKIANGGTTEIWGEKVTLKGNPYTLKEIQEITHGYLPHPNCRSTVVRQPFGGEE